MTWRIKNWEQFQHYRHRRPPWLKLHRSLLDDLEWYALPPAAAKMLVSLWLIASEKDGELPDARVLAFRLRLASKEVESTLALLEHWIEPINTVSNHTASAALAPCKQAASDVLLQSRVEESRVEAEAEEKKRPATPAPSKKTGEENLLNLAEAVRECRPEFANLNTDAILNLLRGVPLPVARRAVAEFCRDELNALQPSNKPLKLLGGYIRTARTAPQFTGAHNVTAATQRANDIAQAREEYAAIETWRTDPPKWAKPGDADKEQRKILASIAAKYGPDAAAEVTGSSPAR